MKTSTTYSQALLLALFFTLAFSWSSCDDKAFLEEQPKDFLAPENAYSSVAGIRQGMNGLQYSARDDWFFGYEHQDVGSIYKGVGTDVAYHGEDPNSTRFLCNYVNYLTSESPYVRDYWRFPFRLIQRANLLVQAIDALEDDQWANPEQRKAYRGEALFFRAFAYRHLVSFFGPVPVITEVITSAKTDFVRDPLEKAYQQMEEDLNYGIANLPDRGKEEVPGRITKGAALHLLTEVFLMQKKYDQAVKSATQVIDGLGYQLMTERFGNTKEVFGTGDVYLDLFAFGNQNLPDNKESIWILQFEPLIEGGSNNRGGRAFGPGYYRMGNTPDGKKAFRGEFINGKYTGYSDTLGRGVAWVRPTNLMSYGVWEGNWDNDIRNAPHMVKRDFYFDNPESSYHGQKVDFSLYPASAGRDAIRDTCQYIYPFFMKFFDPCNVFDNVARSGNGASYKDVYAMRLGETYLYRAEAYIQLGKTEEAAADINRIRARANATPVTAAEVNIDYLLDERARELYLEECRHFVLRRTGKLVERVRKYNNNPLNPGLNIQDHHILWPIPQLQRDLNIDVSFDQNPGY